MPEFVGNIGIEVQEEDDGVKLLVLDQWREKRAAWEEDALIMSVEFPVESAMAVIEAMCQVIKQATGTVLFVGDITTDEQREENALAQGGHDG